MKYSVCLNMIVKNEEEVLEDCLRSVKPWVDTWVISDTGSSDQTKEIVHKMMRGVPGTLIESDWVDFSTSRNEVLQKAKKVAEYSFFIDADEKFIPSPKLTRLQPEADFSMISTKNINYVCNKGFLLKNQSSSFWEGVLHESIRFGSNFSKTMFCLGFLDGTSKKGRRSQDPYKYHKEVKILEKELRKDPRNARYQFYFARALEFSGQKEPALQAYQRRAQMGGSLREVFYAYLRAGVLLRELKYVSTICLESLFQAHILFPKRAEPVYQICLHLIEDRRYEEAYSLLKEQVTVREVGDGYFVDILTRDILIDYAYYRVCYALKKYKDCYETICRLLNNKNIPEDLFKEIYGNYIFFREKHSEYVKKK